MPDTLKQCETCKAEFIGNPKKKFCSSTCRWTAHAYARKGKDLSERIPLPVRKERRIAAGGPVDYSSQGKANRAKGARAEREVCHIVNRITGSEISRNLSQTRDSGSDVQWGPFMLEVKYQKNVALPAWQKQAIAAAKQENLVPAVVHRRAGEEFWISLPFETFVQFFHALRTAAEAARNAK